MKDTKHLDTSWRALLRPWISNRYFDVPCPPPFEPDEGGCSLVNAWWLCELSRLIYRQGQEEVGLNFQSPARSEILEGVGLQEVETFSSGTNYCALISARRSASCSFAALVFRGTSGFDGWLSNLKAVPAYWPAGGWVHSGFKADFLGLWDKIEPFLSRIEFPLYYTGHSLGGALAILAASIYPAKAVYTFGAPKTGDANFADSVKNAQIYRFENEHDIVPTVPPSAMPFDFCHCGIPISLKDDRQTGPATAGIRSLVDPPEFLFHHAPVNYTIRLKNGLVQSRAS
jgi:hypothetical protein